MELGQILGKRSTIEFNVMKNTSMITYYRNNSIVKLKMKCWTDTTEVSYGEHTLHKVRVHVILDLYGRYALSYNISDTGTSSAVIETFNRAFAVEPDAQPMIHTDRGAAYCSSMFNDYLASKNCIHSMSPRSSFGKLTNRALAEWLQANLD